MPIVQSEEEPHHLAWHDMRVDASFVWIRYADRLGYPCLTRTKCERCTRDESQGQYNWRFMADPRVSTLLRHALSIRTHE